VGAAAAAAAAAAGGGARARARAPSASLAAMAAAALLLCAAVAAIDSGVGGQQHSVASSPPQQAETLIHVVAASSHGGGGSTSPNKRRAAAAAADGSEAAPFDTLHAARDAMRGGLGRGGPRTLLIEGSHHLRSPLQLDERDTGTAEAPVTYRSRSASDPARLSGGIRLPSSAFSPASVPSGASGVLKISLFDHGLNSSMVLPLAAVPDQGSSFLTDTMELFVDGHAMTRARSPNIQPDGRWQFAGYENMSGPGLNSSFTDSSNTSFVFTDMSLAPLWLQAARDSGLWLHGYFQHDYRDTYVKVASMEPIGDHYAWNVTRAAETPPGPDSQFTKGSRFYALAALELLDSAGEYHINSTTGELWLLPPRPLTADTELTVSVLENVIDAKLVSHHSFMNIEIGEARGSLIVLAGSGDAHNSGSSNVVQNCTLRNSGSVCAAVAGNNNSIHGNRIYGCGKGGVALFAGMPTSALVPGMLDLSLCRCRMLCTYSLQSMYPDDVLGRYLPDGCISIYS
jgi:hypothetical protein